MKKEYKIYRISYVKVNDYDHLYRDIEYCYIIAEDLDKAFKIARLNDENYNTGQLIKKL